LREEREGSEHDVDLLRSGKRRKLLECCSYGRRTAAAVDLLRSLQEMAWGDLAFRWECSLRRSMGSRSMGFEERRRDEMKEVRC